MQFTLNFFIKILRTFTFIVSLFGLSFYIHEIYIKWNFNPDIMTTEKLISAKEIPMPAITICSPLAVRKETIDLIEIKKNLSLIESHENRTCLQTFQTCIYSPLPVDVEEKNLKIDFEFFDKCSPKFEDFIFDCGSSAFDGECKNFRSKVMSTQGFCYSINLLGNVYDKTSISDEFLKFQKPLKNFESRTFNQTFIDDPEWTLAGGYRNKSSNFPLRAAIKNFLFFKMKMKNEDMTNICGNRPKNYHLIIHKPNEIPSTFHEDVSVKFESSKKIYVTAKLFKADESLRRYLPEQRRCYFEGEKKLKFFTSYTKVQCQLECLTNFTLKLCGCVRYPMPRSKGTKVCHLSDAKCTLNAYNDLDSTKCKCLDPCVDVRYSFLYENSGDFDYLVNGDDAMKLKSQNYTMTSVDVNFFSQEIVSQETFVAYMLQDFIADCGGLIGLFLGFSLLSIVDIVQKILIFFLKFKTKRRSKKLKKSFGTKKRPRFKILLDGNVLELKKSQKNIFVVSHDEKN